MDTVKIRGLLNREAGMYTTCSPRAKGTEALLRSVRGVLPGEDCLVGGV